MCQNALRNCALRRLLQQWREVISRIHVACAVPFDSELVLRDWEVVDLAVEGVRQHCVDQQNCVVQKRDKEDLDAEQHTRRPAFLPGAAKNEAKVMPRMPLWIFTRIPIKWIYGNGMGVPNCAPIRAAPLRPKLTRSIKKLSITSPLILPFLSRSATMCAIQVQMLSAKLLLYLRSCSTSSSKRIPSEMRISSFSESLSAPYLLFRKMIAKEARA
mmetsp:Transcript_9205/g.21874  ORF Transcript_9205/g.21874 Transcript_9205/m.21874 type:complete len:215 (-) Transcript_9205:555-1199(-)